MVVISGPERARAIVNRVGPTLDLTTSPRALELISHAQWLHVDQHGWQPVRDVRDHLDDQIRFSIDGGNHIPALALDGTTLYAPTREMLTRRYGSTDLHANMRRAIADGPEYVVVTDGGSGAYGMCANGQTATATAPDAKIVSTLGAGDVFHGALIAGLTHAQTGRLDGGFAGAVGYATAAATLSCRGVD